MKKYAGENESLVTENEPSFTEKRIDLNSIRPKDLNYEDVGRMDDLSTKVMTGEGMQKMEEAPPKPKVVTKEQMKAAGFDNLRDYLNDKQGLKRRGESAPVKTEPVKAKMNAGMAARTEDRAYKSLEEPSKKPMGKGYEKSRARDESYRNDPSPLDNIRTSARNIAKKLGVSGYAKGGMTASSRGDGIAQRGKTRGKMC